MRCLRWLCKRLGARDDEIPPERPDLTNDYLADGLALLQFDHRRRMRDYARAKKARKQK